jgi:predicted  nucleic acid-binding Zn-ribbon protein
MIIILLWTAALILFLSVTFFLNKKLNIKILDLEKREDFLKIQIKNVEFRENDFEARYAAGKNELTEKESDMSRYYQRILATKEEAYKIKEQSQIQVDLLKKQIIKLQTELANAREKSKRLAKKARNTV